MCLLCKPLNKSVYTIISIISINITYLLILFFAYIMDFCYMEFTACKTEPSLWGMELQEKEVQSLAVQGKNSWQRHP